MKTRKPLLFITIPVMALVMTFFAPVVLQSTDTPGIAPLEWREQLASQSQFQHQDIFPGVDLVLSGSQEKILASLLVQPGSDLSVIQLDFSGGNEVTLDDGRNMRLQTSDGVFQMEAARFYQEKDGVQSVIEGRLVNRGTGLVGVAANNYDPSLPLNITFVMSFGSSAGGGDVTINAVPTIEATKRDAVVGGGDANPGDNLKYTVVIKNTGADTAQSVEYDDNIDPNTSFVNGTLSTTPLADDKTVTVLEDVQTPLSLSGRDPDGDNLTFTIQTPPTLGSLGSISPAGPTSANVNYTSNANKNGADSFVFKVKNDNNNEDRGTVGVTITPVNDAPVFSCGPNQTHSTSDGPAISVIGWATGIAAGPATATDEAGQILTFNVTGNTNPALFTTGPAVNASNGNLTYTLAAITGQSTITLELSDNGGTLNGGDDTSNPCSFTIFVNGPPNAVDDNYNTPPNTTISRSTSDPDDLLDNDNLGTPAATLTSFGGGDLGGSVTGHAAASTVSPLPSFGNGSLTVNANGSFSFTPPTGFTGNYTFDYRITNVAGTSDATVTISVQAGPTAVADNYFTTVNTSLSRATSDPDDLLDNDDLGTPAATLTSFGGGTLGGSVTSNAAGSTANVGGHSLTVNANGSFTYSPASGFTGNFTFNYRLTNVAGTSDALVTIEVRQAPTAVADNYNTQPSATISRAASDPDDLLDNDNLGFPLATLQSFGGGNLGGAVTDHAAGSTVSPLPSFGNGSLTVNANGSFSFTPPTGFTGNYTFDYYITNVAGSSAATVTIAVQAMPVAAADNYFTNINTPISRATSDPDDLLDNDNLGSPAATLTSFGGGTLGGAVTTNAAGASVALAGGTLTVNSDGSFSLTTPTTAGSFNFQYRITNIAGTSDATVTIEVRQAPTAVADNYNTLVNTTLTVNTSDPNDLLDNDTRGFPLATIASFGGGSLGGAVTDHAAGTSAALAGGTLTVNSDGSFLLMTPTTTGNFTFDYYITSVAGSSAATVTIQVRKEPTAVADNYVTQVNTTISRTTANTDDLLDNDDRGFPLATIINFGGGSLGGTVTTNAAGASVPLAGGTLQVNSDGSFSLTTPTTAGSFNFQYRLSNVVNFSDATVTIEVQGAPTANDDSPIANSVPGNAFHTAFNTTLNSSTDPITPSLLVNDNLGFPAGTLTFFGGGSLGGAVTDNAAGNTANFGGSGSLQVLATGEFVFTPDNNFTGLFTFQYRLTNSAGSDDATVTIAVGVRPVSVADTRTATGNVSLSTATNLLTNDTGDQLTVTAFSATSVPGSSVNVNANGTFTYNPPAGFEGSDSFNYTAGNGFGSGGTVTVTITVSDMIWFIDNSAASAGDGRLTSPFNTLAAFEAINGNAGALNPQAGDDIFIYDGSGGYTGGLTLESNQKLIGDGASGVLATILGITLATGSDPLPVFSGTDPVIENASGNGISVALDNTIRGLTIGNTPAANARLIGNGIGTLTVADVSIDGTGQILSVNNGTFNATFNELSTTSTTQTAVVLSNLSGSVTDTDASNSSISGASGVFSITSGTTTPVSLTFNGDVTHAGANPLVFVQNHGTGTVTFQNGTMTSTGGGLTFLNADGTYNFNGTTSLSNGPRIAISGLSSGSFNFSTNTSVNNPANVAFDLDGSNATVDYNGTLSSNTAFRLVSITNNTGGSATFDGSLSATGNTLGIHFQQNTGGTYSFTNSSKVINTSATANTAVNVVNNTGATIEFTGGGLDIDSNNGIGFNASGGGTINVTGANNSINTADGVAIDFDGPTLGMTFASVSSASSSGAGIQLDNISGTLTMNGGSLTGATLTEFDVGDVANGSGGNATVVYAGSITNTAGRAVLIQELSGGSYSLSGNISHSAAGVGIQVSEINNGTAATVTFSGTSKVVNSGASNGVHLATNPNGTIEFTNGGLDIDATSGIGFNATGGGIVNVTGASNSITTTTGTALNVVSTTIGASGLTFQSISSSGGTATGIILDNTGSSGGLTVTGTGTAGSGGTIANKTGANGSTTTGIGIYLNSTSSVSLTRMQLNDFQNYAIRGNSVTGFTLSNCVINGANGNTSGEGTSNEGSIRFDNLFGSASISSSTVTGGSYDNVSVFNTSGTLNRLTVSSSTLATSLAVIPNPLPNDALRFEGSGTSTTMNITVQNSFFTAAHGDLFNSIANGNTVMDVVFTGNACSNNHPDIVSGGGGITIAGSQTGFSPTVTYNVSGSNTFRDAKGNAITIFKGNGGGTFSGTVENNTIGTATSLSGSSQASGIRLTTSGTGSHTTRINGNTVQQYNEAGIYVLLTDGSATMNATITNNTTTDAGAFAFTGLFIDCGGLSTDSHFLCASISGNNFSAGDPANVNDIFLKQNAATTIRLPGYGGGAADTGAVSAFLIANNPTAGTTASATVSGSGGGFVGGAACTTP